MSPNNKKTVLFLSLLLLSIFGVFVLFVISQSQFQKSQISNEVRQKLKQHLKSLPSPPFKKNLGHQLTKQEAELGRMLFNDPVLSRNNDVSCATCHLTNHGFADGNRLNFGALGEGGPTGQNVGKKWGEGKLSLNRFCSHDGFGFFCKDPMFRNSLSTINVIYRANPHTDSGLLWDGRFGRLTFQVLLPIHTPEEMCGVNPIPITNNPFQKGGPLFDKPVTITHSHLFDIATGKQIFSFNSPPQVIHSVESFRANSNLTYPSRNECLAIAVSKVRKIPWYQKQFKKVFQSEVTDLLIGIALASFVSTHVANNSPYDRFIKQQDSLSLKQIKGLVMFMTPLGETININQENIRGAGCAHCHSPPYFGGSGFYTLGIRGDERSSLSRPELTFESSGFTYNIYTSHGRLPPCHVTNVSSSLSQTSPDIGRAIFTSQVSNCFQFRTPVLRNVIETYPYFHHGTETGIGFPKRLTHKNFKNLSLYSLKRSIQYHLKGPVDITTTSRLDPKKSYFDEFFQIDPLIPPLLMDFGPNTDNYPLQLSEEELSALVDFVAFGLYDEQATQTGYLNNQLHHPRRVPSGLFPSITRDQGTQFELPPKGQFNRSLYKK